MGLLAALANHVDLADGFVNAAGSFPVLWEERDRVGFDLDHLAGLVGVGAATLEKMTELITGDVAIPIARRAHPDAGLRLAVGPSMEEHPRCHRLALDHGRNRSPVFEIGDIAGDAVNLVQTLGGF